jgi:hypothetical protein
VLLAVEAVWNDYDHDDVAESSTPTCEADEQVFLAISKAAVLGNSSARTVWFAGYIHGQPVHILIDSSSSASFLSETVANQLSGIESKLISTRVQLLGILISRVQSCCVMCPGQLVSVPFSLHSGSYRSRLMMLLWVWIGWRVSVLCSCFKWLLIPYQG